MIIFYFKILNRFRKLYNLII